MPDKWLAAKLPSGADRCQKRIKSRAGYLTTRQCLNAAIGENKHGTKLCRVHLVPR